MPISFLLQIRRNVIYNVYMFKPAEAEAKQRAFEEEQRQAAAAAQNGGSRGKGKKAAPAAA